MHFNEYQVTANKTDQVPAKSEDDIKSIMMPLLGLADESGSLLTEYKKYLIEGPAYRVFEEKIAEELGDILWYVANIATKAKLDLDEVAQKNLSKIADRWHEYRSPLSGAKLLDDGYPCREQFPRQFEIEVESEADADGRFHVQLFYKGRQFGDSLTDNSYEDDGYRLHDVFHLAFVAVLCWSPVLRSTRFFNCKRKSKKDVDTVQDGGRAAVIDEAIAALVFTEGKKRSFFDGVNAVDYSLLRTIKDLTAHLEVNRCSAKQWEAAVLSGFHIWRALRSHQSGRIVGDLLEQSIKFVPK